MQTIKKILRYLFGFYAMLMFTIIGMPYLIILITILKTSGNNAFENGLRFTRFWARSYLFFFGMHLKVEGREQFKKGHTYVIVSNHVSLIDILACYAAIPVSFKFLAKKETGKIPFVGFCVRHLHLFVDRKSKASRAESMKAMAESLASGISIMIYPEGTRNKGPEFLKSFYDGAFNLAIKTKTPLVALTIQNTWSRQNQLTGFQLTPGKVKCIFNPPIETEGMTDKDIPALKEKVRETIKSQLAEKYGESYY
jgi:1-acyl-sn-glycerol-3-phosphate acyltransferase